MQFPVGGREFRFAFIPKANLKQTWAQVEKIAPQIQKGKCKTKKSEDFWATKTLWVFVETAGLF